MKIIKFPEHRIKRNWLMKIKNYDKNKIFNFIFSFSSLLIGLAITWFILHRLNS